MPRRTFDKTVLVALAVMLTILVVAIDSWLKQWRANKENKKWVQDILALSLEEAMRRTEPMLSDPEYFELTPAEAGDVEIARTFGPALHSLFSRYAVIHYDWNDMNLSCRDIVPYEWDSRYAKIGSGLYGQALWVLPPDDRVHEVWDRNPNPQNWGERSIRVSIIGSCWNFEITSLYRVLISSGYATYLSVWPAAKRPRGREKQANRQRNYPVGRDKQDGASKLPLERTSVCHPLP